MVIFTNFRTLAIPFTIELIDIHFIYPCKIWWMPEYTVHNLSDFLYLFLYCLSIAEHDQGKIQHTVVSCENCVMYYFYYLTQSSKEACQKPLVQTKGGNWQMLKPLGRKSWKVPSVDLALSTVNKSSRPLLEPWMCWIPASFCFFLQGCFYSLRPHGALGRIKDWWELSESVYCSRDPRMCYEWEDCVAALPPRSSWGWCSTEVVDNQG